MEPLAKDTRVVESDGDRGAVGSGGIPHLGGDLGL